MLRSPDEYRAGLADGRRVFSRGRQVKPLDEPDLRVAIDHAALDFAVAHDPNHRSLAVIDDADVGEYSAYYRVPRSSDDLLERSALIELVTGLGGTMVTLVKEIGSDALFALMRTLDGPARERVVAYYEYCRDDDLAVAVGQTDVKGDRALPPHQQPDPDHYVHIVEERPDGIVVRGAKCHTSVSANSDEIIVLPTRAMGPDDADYAVSFAVPIDTPGLNLYVSGYHSTESDEFSHPISSKHRMLESLTVFDDVFVPNERVFLQREPELAGPLALAFVEFHRFTAVSYKLPLLDLLVGSAARIAQINGVAKANHIKEKLAKLVIYAETVRGLTHQAATKAFEAQHGIWVPDPLTTNLAKYTFATQYHQHLQYVQDCAGGLLVTGPNGDDWNDPSTRTVLEKYFGAAEDAETRLAMINLISDLTVRDLGGYHAVLAVHAEGSIEAEKMQILREYDLQPKSDYADRLAGGGS
jgi:4-hydroxybutyryl-CoA dehydratase/vinylacetyl-CoA-Delta-isomerase